jgi:hypothetical protein
VEGASFNIDGDTILWNCRGEPISCYRCGGNHFNANCPELATTNREQHIQMEGEGVEHSMQHMMETLGMMDENTEESSWQFGSKSEFVFCIITKTAAVGAVLHTSISSEIPK